jgi:hypothetical protein
MWCGDDPDARDAGRGQSCILDGPCMRLSRVAATRPGVDEGPAGGCDGAANIVDPLAGASSCYNDALSQTMVLSRIVRPCQRTFLRNDRPTGVSFGSCQATQPLTARRQSVRVKVSGKSLLVHLGSSAPTGLHRSEASPPRRLEANVRAGLATSATCTAGSARTKRFSSRRGRRLSFFSDRPYRNPLRFRRAPCWPTPHLIMVAQTSG